MSVNTNHQPATIAAPEIAQQFLLKPGITFLNHGSFGACPRPVFEVFQQWQRRLEEHPGGMLGSQHRDLLANARARLADYLGAAADSLVLIPNATYGINVVRNSLKLKPGDEILTSNHEYGAMIQAWTFFCRQHQTKLIQRPIPLPIDSQEAIVEHIWAGVTDRTRVIFLSHITSPTALTLPIKAICHRARAANILTVIDGAHVPGQRDLNLDDIGADFYTGNGHKWLCTPKGSAFLYARPEVQSLLDPLVVGWSWGNERPDSTPFLDHFTWVGTDDPSAYLSFPAAIDFQIEHNWPQVRQACHQMGRALRDRIQALTDLPHLYPDSEDWWMQMQAIPIPVDDPTEIRSRLWDEFQIEVPVLQWEGRSMVRVSIQAYNSPEDIDRLVEGLTVLLR